MSNFVPVLDVQALPCEGLKSVEVNGRMILIGRIGGQLVAFLDRCPHAGAPLRIGRLRGSELTCAWHGWMFDVTTGESVPAQPDVHLIRYPVKIEGGKVWVLPTF